MFTGLMPAVLQSARPKLCRWGGSPIANQHKDVIFLISPRGLFVGSGSRILAYPGPVHRGTWCWKSPVDIAETWARLWTNQMPEVCAVAWVYEVLKRALHFQGLFGLSPALISSGLLWPAAFQRCDDEETAGAAACGQVQPAAAPMIWTESSSVLT